MQLRTFTACKQRALSVTLTLQMDPFIIYTLNDNATYIRAQLRHLHFNSICVTKNGKGTIVHWYNYCIH